MNISHQDFTFEVFKIVFSHILENSDNKPNKKLML